MTERYSGWEARDPSSLSSNLDCNFKSTKGSDGSSKWTAINQQRRLCEAEDADVPMQILQKHDPSSPGLGKKRKASIAAPEKRYIRRKRSRAAVFSSYEDVRAGQFFDDIGGDESGCSTETSFPSLPEGFVNHSEHDRFDSLSDSDLDCLFNLFDEPRAEAFAEQCGERFTSLEGAPEVAEDDSDEYGGLGLSDEDLATIQLPSPSDLEASVDAVIAAKPIVRPKFPELIRKRPVILGISSETSLKVCFRVGEAINVGVLAQRRGMDVVIELYARVAYSSRLLSTGSPGEDILNQGTVSLETCASPTSRFGLKRSVLAQRFILYDLFHSRPPHLLGTYELWYNSDVWNKDSQVFLSNECEQSESLNLCRCVGRIKREIHEETREEILVFTILHVRQTSWNEVEAMKQLVAELAS